MKINKEIRRETCKRCCGQGFIWLRDDTLDCPVCKGKGHLIQRFTKNDKGLLVEDHVTNLFKK